MKRLVIITIFSIYSFDIFSSCPTALQNHPVECDMAQRYSNVAEDLYFNHGINVEYLTGYRARRLIAQDVWEQEQDRIQCRPEKAYLPDPDVWENWEKGAHFVARRFFEQTSPSERDSLHSFTYNRDFIREINQFSVDISIMGVMATDIKGARPGQIRTQGPVPAPGFTFGCVGADVTSEHVENVKNFEILNSDNEPLVSIVLASAPCPQQGIRQGVLSYTSNRYVDTEVSELVELVNSNIESFRNGELQDGVSPLEFVADKQRHFVAIHPFGDGNGRTSRFLQDYMLSHFGLPFAPSGNLQEDVLMTRDGYREKFIEETSKTLEMLEGCQQEINEKGLDNIEQLSCDCRPMYMGELTPPPLNLYIYDGNGRRCGEYTTREVVSDDFSDFLYDINWVLGDQF